MPQRPTQKSFRGRDDSVGLNTNTFTYALNANFSFSVLAPFRIRFCIQDVSTGGAATYHLRYSKNGGGYSASTNITNASAQVKIVDSAQFADNDATTRLLDGTGDWVNGAGMDSSENSPSITELALGQTEVEWCLQFVAADVTNGDTFAFEVFRGTTAMYAYTSIPTVTVQKVFSISAPAQAAKVSEGLNAGLSTPAVWQPALTESAKATEAIGITVAEAPIVDLSVQVAQSVKYAGYVNLPVYEGAKLTESVTAAVAAQPVREVNASQTAKGTEDVAVAVAAPVTLEVAVEQTARANEDYTIQIQEGAVEYLEVSTPAETVAASEEISAARQASATLEANVVATVRLTEDESTTVEGMLPDLSVRASEVVDFTDYITLPIYEVCRVSESVSVVLAQLALELAAIDSVAVVDSISGLSIGGEEEVTPTRYLYPAGMVLSRCQRTELFHLKK